MLNFDLGDDLQLIVDTAARFAREQLRPAARPAEQARTVSPELGAAFAELGLGALDLPESVGGHGAGLVETVCVAETLAAGDAGLALALPQAGAFGRLLRLLGSPEQQATFLEPFAANAAHARGAIAVLEGATTAVPHNGGTLLRGQATHVLHAGRAEHVIVVARLEARQREFAAFVLPMNTAGIEVGPRHALLGLEVVHAAPVTFADVLVETPQRLQAADVADALDAFFAAEGLITAAHAVGVTAAAHDYALAFANDRTAFGKPIAHFQSIAFLLADMHIQCDAARWLLRQAAWAADRQDPDARRLMYAARAQADEMAFFVTDNAVQILGGAGYVQDHPVEKWMRDVATLASFYGSRESADCRAAAALLGPSDAQTMADHLPLGALQPAWT